MVSQPVVAGPLVGWLLGDLHAGMVIGAALELLWVLDMPIGTFVPADSTVSAVAATSIAALAHPGGAPHWLLGFCILLTAAIVPVTMFADRIMRTWNARLPYLAYCSRGVVTTARVTIAHLRGLAAFFMKSAALYLLVLPAGLAAAAWCMNAPEPLRRALDLFSRVMPLLGAAAVLRKLSLR
jgi:mannose/fructose/N-acetylgalactosamine-specific phosphotransferase system component IIC